MADQKAPIKPALAKREIGYSDQYPGNYWWVDNETTPELRWPLNIRVFEVMGRQDSQIKSVMRALTLPVIRSKWRLEPRAARPEVVQHIAGDLNLPVVGQDDSEPAAGTPLVPLRSRNKFSWKRHVRQTVTCMLQFGHMFYEQVYRIDDAGWAHLAKLGPRMPQSLAAITLDKNGELLSISQFAMGTLQGFFVGGAMGAAGGGTPIPANRLVAYIHEPEAGAWIGQSIMRPVYKNWMIKDRLLRVQAQTIERNGMGVPIYELAPQETSTAAGEALATGLRAGDSSGAAIPSGAKLRLEGIQGQIPDANTPIRYHDEQIAKSVLAHALTLGTQTGSWALGSTFMDFFVMSLQTIADTIAETANQHIIEDIVDLNWGPDEPAPLLVCDEIGSMHDATAEAIATLVAAGVVLPDGVLERAVRTSFGLPPKQPGTPEAQPEAPASTDIPSPGPDIDGDDDSEDDNT